MDEIDIIAQNLIEEAKKEAERSPKTGERSAIEFINDLTDKALSFTSEKLEKIIKNQGTGNN